MTQRAIIVGVGAMGRDWCSVSLPPNIAEGRVDAVAAVDINPDALPIAKQALGLRDDQLFTDFRRAFDAVPADFCIVVTPPDQHEIVVDAALAHGMDVLSEKPIADTLEGSIRIANKVRAAGKKMAVTMSHRYDRDKTTLRDELRSGRHGALDYLVCRFTCSFRRHGDWGAAFRHEIPDTLMVEGAVHHLDLLADLAGAPCDTLYAQTWTPPWGEYKGDAQGLVTMQFQNGVRATYEGAKTNAAGLNCWENEYIRAECEHATLILNRRELERFPYVPGDPWRAAIEGTGTPIALLDRPKWQNTWLLEQFVQWRDGGDPMATNVADNLQSVAMVFSAIESSRSGRPVAVQDFLAAAKASGRGRPDSRTVEAAGSA